MCIINIISYANGFILYRFLHTSIICLRPNLNISNIPVLPKDRMILILNICLFLLGIQ